MCLCPILKIYLEIVPWKLLLMMTSLAPTQGLIKYLLSNPENAQWCDTKYIKKITYFNEGKFEETCKCLLSAPCVSDTTLSIFNALYNLVIARTWDSYYFFNRWGNWDSQKLSSRLDNIGTRWEDGNMFQTPVLWVNVVNSQYLYLSKKRPFWEVIITPHLCQASPSSWLAKAVWLQILMKE